MDNQQIDWLATTISRHDNTVEIECASPQQAAAIHDLLDSLPNASFTPPAQDDVEEKLRTAAKLLAVAAHELMSGRRYIVMKTRAAEMSIKESMYSAEVAIRDFLNNLPDSCEQHAVEENKK